ncbi:MAG: carboxypeptidase-like regulatory domain-containing protein, partial [Thermoanaerobaculia bacterium]
MSATRFLSLAIVALALAISVPAFAQTTGRLRGTVVDLDELFVPGVTVTITSELLMGGSRTAVTGGTGAYRFTALPPGIYKATAELDGFAISEVDGVKVAINATADVHFALQPAKKDVITVTGEAPLVDVASSSLGTNFTSKFLQDLPTNRNVTDMMAVSPGATFGMEDNPFH